MSNHDTKPPAPQVLSDDAIRKFQGRMVSINGWQFPIAVRYVSWGLFLFIIFPITLLGDRLLTGAISPIPAVDLIIAAFLTNQVANYTSGEAGIEAVAVYGWRKIRAGLEARRHPKADITSDRVRARRRQPLIYRKDRGDR